MSTAVMQSSALYDFRDILYKNHTATSNNSNNANSSSSSQQQQQQHQQRGPGSSSSTSSPSTSSGSAMQQQQKVLRWGPDPCSRAVGGPSPLARRSSNPGTVSSSTATIAVTASLVSSVSSLILDNIRGEATSTSAQATNSLPISGPPHHRKLDRSQSEPASAASAAAAAAAASCPVKGGNPLSNASRYKTELCRPFEESGSCKYGDKCQFAHGAQELRSLARHPKYKTELCRTFHSTGFCPYGPRCHFIHNADEARSKPKPLELAGSTAESPTSSLSQSPTNSVGSFFTDAGDVFSSMSPPPVAQAPPAFPFGQDFNPLVPLNPAPGSPVPSLAGSSVGSLSPRGSPPPPLATENSPRLPVFNRLSSSVHLGLGGLQELLA